MMKTGGGAARTPLAFLLLASLLSCSDTDTTAVGGTSSELSSTLELTAEADTFLKRGSPNKNQGDESALVVRRAGKNRTLVQFDQAAIEEAVAGDAVVEARLELAVTHNGGQWGRAGRSVGIHRMIAPWTELGATWKCGDDANTGNRSDDCQSTAWDMNDSSAWPFEFAPTSTTLVTNDTAGVLSLDVTADVQAFLSGDAPNLGWLVRLVNETQSGRLDFASRDTATPPKLVITVGTDDTDPEPPDQCQAVGTDSDTYVRKGAPNQNQGGVGMLRIRSAGRNRALLQVDVQSLIDASGGNPVDAAELKVTVSHNGGNWGEGGEVDLHRLLVPWDELTATWNCGDDSNIGNHQPDCDAAAWDMDAEDGTEPYEPTPVDAVVVTNEATELAFDVTADVQAAIDGASDYGWLLRKRDESRPGLIEFVAAEASATAGPRIIVCPEDDDGGDPTPPEDCRNGVDDDGDGFVDCADPECQLGGPDGTCDGIDDDCDGLIDEDFVPFATQCGVGACAAVGTRSCVSGQPVDSCVPGTPAVNDAICDGVDEDCDGAADEDYLSQPTVCGLGECVAAGASVCTGGIEEDGCVPGVPASSDPCNGLDDDCDATTDEDFVSTPTTCGVGACAASGDLTCVGGVVVDTCQPGAPASDDATCDVIDDDCDGQTDEDCCIPATCQDYNVNCGSVDDGCGGTLDCGSCPAGETCGGGGVANVCGSGLPPSPEDIAPQTNVGAGDFLHSFGFLTEGPNPIQTGVAPDAIEAQRAAVLRGRVLTTSGQPIVGVKVSVPADPLLGHTTSRADGGYDLLVNGGGLVTLEYTAVGYLPVQRTTNVAWEGVITLDDVVMTPASDVATVVDFNSVLPQVAESRPVTDNDGTRKIVGFFPAGTQAVAEIDGQSVPLTSGTLRMTEYTVGDSGAQAMPARLPENSMYTFAADLSFDEAGPVNRVTFNQTTYFYLDNFLGFAPGTVIPNGYYDYELSQWVAENDGLVMAVVGVTAEGLAEIDASWEDPEDQVPEIPADLALIGMTDEERREIAQRYPVGTSFWRMPIEHLSPYDWNHAGLLREPPIPEPPPRDDLSEPDESDCEKGSIIHCQSRTLGERIRIAGTPYSFHYSSSAAGANVIAGRTAVIPLPQDAPSDTQSMRLRVKVLGRTLVDEELPLGTESYVVEWDGRDVYGREWEGSATLYYSVSFIRIPAYNLALRAEISPREAASFGVSICKPEEDPCCRTPAAAGGSGTVPTVFDVVPGRPSPGRSPDFEGELLLRPLSEDQFGGWTLSHYHRYEPDAGDLLLGTGQVHSGLNAPTVLAGRRSDNDYLTDVATPVDEFNDIAWPEYIAVGPDGWVYFTRKGQSDLWRARRGDGLERVADFYLNGICSVRGLAVDRHGDVYAGCTSYKIVRLSEVAGGQWESEVIAGGNSDPSAVWQDGDSLANTHIFPTALTFREDGRLFFVLAQTSSRNYGASDRPYELVEYLPDGTGRIVPVEVGPAIDGGPNNTIVSFYKGDNVGSFSGSVVRIYADFSFEILSTPVKPDNTGKTRVGFDWESTDEFDPLWVYIRLRGVAAMPNGDIYVSFHDRLFQFSNGLVRRVSLSGLPQDFAYDIGSSMRNALEDNPGGMPGYLADRADGVLYVADDRLNRIYELNSEPRTDVPSESGLEAYHFADSGVHERTSDANTGATLYDFVHDADGNLQSITDRNGHTTTIERPDSSTILIVTPAGPGGTEGVTTTIRLNQEGHIEEVENPRGARWFFEYDSGGLLERMWDPRANENGPRAGAPHSYAYERFDADPDAKWLLKRDTDPAGGEQTLATSHSRTVDTLYGIWCDGTQYVRGYEVRDTTSTVTKTTQLGRQKRFETRQERGSPRDAQTSGAVAGLITTTRTEPNGWYEVRTDPDPSGRTTVTWPGGMSTHEVTSHHRLTAPATELRSSSTQIEPVTGAYPRAALAVSLQKEAVSDFDAPLSGVPLPDSETVTTTVTPQNGEPRVSTVQYDGLTRTQTVTSAENRERFSVLDSRSRIVELKLPGQVPFAYSYGADGRLQSISRTKGARVRRTEFGYDSQGYVSSVKNKVSDTVTDEVTMDNDAMGFATQTQIPGLLSVDSTPDIAGALSSLMPDGKPAHQLSYSPLGQLRQYASPAGTLSTDGSCPSGTQCWGYSLDRELDDITLPDGSQVDLVYDAVKGTLTSIDVPEHGVTTFGYDSVGRRVSANSPSGGTMGFSWQSTLPIRTAWQGTHTVTDGAATVWSGTVDGAVERFHNDFLEVAELHVAGGASLRLLRDKDGLVTDIEDVGGVLPTLTMSRSAIDGHVEATNLGTVTTTHTLDVSETAPGFGDLLAVSANAGTTGLYDASYTYDDRGRIDTWTETVLGSTTARKLHYDAAGRLVEVEDLQSGSTLEEYAYDGNGNRTRAISTGLNAELGTNIGCPDASGIAANDEDQLCRYGDFEYRYNARGQLEERERASDGSTTRYTYDGLGRLKKVVTEAGLDVRYVHDALGRRIGKVVDGQLDRGWLYADALNPVAQLDENGDVEATFVYGMRAHVPDAMAMADGSVYRFITDHLGSVRLVVDVNTGTVAQRLDYDSLGRIVNDTNPGFQPFGFAGGLYDQDTGLVRFGARDYDAYTGRWTAKDPILFESHQVNVYAYVRNDPINLIDPTGLKCSYVERVWRNFFETNTAIPGLLAPPAAGLITGGAFAQYLGLPSFGSLAIGAASGAFATGEAVAVAGGGVGATAAAAAEGAALGFGAAGGIGAIPSAAFAAAGNFLAAGLVFEAGVLAGSAIAAALPWGPNGWGFDEYADPCNERCY